MTNSKNAFGTTEMLARAITMSLRASEKLTMVGIDLMRFSNHRRLWRLDVAFGHAEQGLEWSKGGGVEGWTCEGSKLESRDCAG